MEIVVRQISGLGNQLFQYAAGRFYAKKYGGGLRIATDPAKRAVSYGSPRPFLLSKFAIEAATRELGRLDRLFLAERRVYWPTSFLARRALNVQVIRERFVERYTFRPELPIEGKAQTVFLVGYWQVHSIPDAIEKELREELRLPDEPMGANLVMAERIQRAAVPVSLHIRRGDYTLAAEGNPALPIQYYLRCIQTIVEKMNEPTFFVFSDDMEYAKKNLPGNVNLIFVDQNGSFEAHEDVRLMSMCRHHIIANSTLSWWGAWLNARPDKVVLAPKHWRVGGCTESGDLLPREWLLIDDNDPEASHHQDAASPDEYAHP